MEVGNHALFPGCFTSGTHWTGAARMAY